MAGNLRARLARIREATDRRSRPAASRPAPGESPDASPVGASEFPDGWETIAPGLRFRESVRRDGAMASPRSAISLPVFSPRLVGMVEAGGLLFFDLETTGLSGGAGTVAFLAAFGSLRTDGSLSVRQYFMDDYPYERALVAAMSDEFAKASAVVSYNGSSFDLPLYAVRRAMAGLGPAPSPPHADALHAARRLWRRSMPDCSLGCLEAGILGVRRVGDIPGSEVPAVWFDFLRSGRTERLGRVFSHNEQDIASLASLAFAMHDAARGERELPSADPIGLAELRSRVDEGLAERTLSAALEAGDARATRPLMRLYRRTGRADGIAPLVPFLPDDPAGLFSKSVYAERRLRDPSEALRLAELAAVLAAELGRGGVRDRALKRAARLRARLTTAVIQSPS